MFEKKVVQIEITNLGSADKMSVMHEGGTPEKFEIDSPCEKFSTPLTIKEQSSMNKVRLVDGDHNPAEENILEISESIGGFDDNENSAKLE